MNRLLLSLIILSLFLLSACSLFPEIFPQSGSSKCKCGSPSEWSDCRQIEAIKTRYYFECGEHTDYMCKKAWEKRNCSREMFFKGNFGLEAKLSPTIDEIVRGIVRVEVLSVPDNTHKVLFFFYPENITLSSNMSRSDLARLVNYTDYSGKDGWKMLIDTTTFKNGNYKITVRPTFEEAVSDVWLDQATADIVIKN